MDLPFRLRLHVLPILIWLAALACVIGLFSRRSQRFEVLGIAQGRKRQVTATSTARVSAVSVGLFDKVEAGQTIAVLNTVLEDEPAKEQLQAQLDTVLAEIERLSAQLVPTQDTLSAEKADRLTDRINDSRRFAVDVEAARLQALRLRTEIETDRITLKDLSVDVAVAEKLVAEEALAPLELQKAKAQYNALAKKIQETENLLDQAEATLERAVQRRQQYVQHKPYHPSIDAALEVIRKEISVQEKRVEELVTQMEALDRRKALELKAPMDGIVSHILHRQTEVVLAGDPILTVAENEIANIIAYAGEKQTGEIEEGMVVEVVKTSDSASVQVEQSEVTFIGPTVEQIPAQLWQNPNVPQWGRPFLIKAPVEMKLIVGEKVGVRTRRKLRI
jgi:multidrug resistance efflux pump